MFATAAEHPVLAALAVLFAGWVVRIVRKGYAVRKTFHDQVCCMTGMVDLADSGLHRCRLVHRTHGFGVISR